MKRMRVRSGDISATLCTRAFRRRAFGAVPSIRTSKMPNVPGFDRAPLAARAPAPTRRATTMLAATRTGRMYLARLGFLPDEDVELAFGPGRGERVDELRVEL